VDWKNTLKKGQEREMKENTKSLLSRKATKEELIDYKENGFGGKRIFNRNYMYTILSSA
jgi:hypothetical protein